MQNRLSFSFRSRNLLLLLNKLETNTTYWLYLTSVAALKDAVNAPSILVCRATVGPLYKLSIGRNSSAVILQCLACQSASVGKNFVCSWGLALIIDQLCSQLSQQNAVTASHIWITVLHFQPIHPAKYCDLCSCASRTLMQNRIRKWRRSFPQYKPRQSVSIGLFGESWFSLSTFWPSAPFSVVITTYFATPIFRRLTE